MGKTIHSFRSLYIKHKDFSTFQDEDKVKQEKENKQRKIKTTFIFHGNLFFFE